MWPDSIFKGRTSGHHPLLLLPEDDVDQRHGVEQVRLPRAAMECLRASQPSYQSRTPPLLRCLPYRAALSELWRSCLQAGCARDTLLSTRALQYCAVSEKLEPPDNVLLPLPSPPARSSGSNWMVAYGLAEERMQNN